ncbi:MAG: helix-turn-helix transcriptional regulator [Clostridium butyricum]|nr:helix-turn-helix transcriptional regulator [Clostridium butyricum]
MGVNDIIKVGSNIKRIRKNKKLSQKDMAKILNIPSSTYSNYENNNREPSAELLKKVAQILGVDLSDLLSINIPKKSISNSKKYLLDNNNTIETIEKLIKLCEFNIKFNEFPCDNSGIEESLKLAVENNAIPLTYISNGTGTLNMTNAEFMKLTDKVLRFVKFELNSLISQNL